MTMHTWMVPKNKRRLTSVIDTLFLFVSANEGNLWRGDRGLQRKFEEMLEGSGLKRAGQPWDPNSGGARTYEAQLSCLGLIFLDTANSPNIFRPTLAGQAILEGKDPLPIMQNQLLKMQYPSAYSKRSNVKISDNFQVHPFTFICRLLLDEEIGFLNKKEIARFILGYARKDTDIDQIKRKILQYRDNENDSILPDTFLEDTRSSRTLEHTMNERINYLEDKANIFINYLESAQLILRPEAKSKIIINPEYVELIERSINNSTFIRNPENQIAFQRRYGLDLEHSKDTRTFAGVRVTDASIKERIVMREFFNQASTNLVIEFDETNINRLHTATGISKEEIFRILDSKRPDGLAYFEERYLDMATKGRDECIDFEIATAELFEKVFSFISKHIGQKRPVGRRGGNPDVVLISESANYSGLIDTKAYIRYSITNDHKNRMLYDYIPNINEHTDKQLKFFIYISGGFSTSFVNGLKDIVDESKIEGSGITAKNLIRLVRKSKTKEIDHDSLAGLFTANKEITAIDIQGV